MPTEENPTRTKIGEAELLHLSLDRERTGIGPDRLLKGRNDIPEGLSPETIRSWFKKDVRSARPDHLKYVQAKWAELPTQKFMDITEAVLKKLHKHLERTGIGASELLRDVDSPEGLTDKTIRNWFSKRSQTARKDHIEFVMKEWAQKPSREYLVITSEITSRLNKLREETGIGPYALLHGKRLEKPEGLDVVFIQKVLSGKLEKVRKDYLEYVIAQWSHHLEKSNDFILITSELRHHFRNEINRTGVTARILLYNRPDIPDGLTTSIVNRWIGGLIKNATKSHVDFIVAAWGSLRDKSESTGGGTRLPGPVKPYSSTSERWVPLTKDMSRQIRTEFAQTHLTPENILENSKDAPANLSARIIRGWMYKHVNSVNEEYWDYVLDRLKNTIMPAEPLGQIYKPRSAPSKNPPITEENLATLRAHRERTGIGGGLLLRYAKTPKPSGLSEAMIASWLSGNTGTAKSEYIAYVLELYASLPSRNTISCS